MTPWWWSYLLTAIGIVGIILAGRKSKWGWTVGIGAQVLWIFYALITSQYGFLLSAFVYGGVYIMNFIRWRRDERAAVSTSTSKETNDE